MVLVALKKHLYLMKVLQKAIMKKAMKDIEGDGHYLEKLHELHNDLPFLAERMKIHKIRKFVSNWHGEQNMLFM